MNLFRRVRVTPNDHKLAVDGLQEVRGVKPTDGIKTDAVLKRPAGTETGDGGYDEGEAVEDFMADPSNWITK